MSKGRKSMLLPVEMQDTVDVMDGISDVTHKREKAIVVTKPDGPKIVHFCSKSYQLVPMSDILLPFETDLKTLGTFETKCRSIDDAIFYVDFIFTEDVFRVGKKRYKKNDGITPMIRMAHSYNGWVKFRLSYGYHRLICSNGLSVFDYKGGFKVKHTDQIKDGNAFKLCKDSIQSFVDDSKTLWKPYNKMSKIEVGDWEGRVLEIITSVPGLPKREEPQGEILANVQKEMDNFGVKQADEWLIYNGINSWINHSSTMETEGKFKLDQKLLDYMMVSVS